MMVTSPRFLGPLEVRKLAGGRWWLLRDLAYDSAVAQARIVVPAEFVTDFASVPRLPFAYWFTGNTGHGAAVIHDWLYQHPASGDRRLADAVLREALGVQQPALGHEAEPAWRRQAMWAGVRAFGWWPWRGDKGRAAGLNPEWTAAEWPALAVEPPAAAP